MVSKQNDVSEKGKEVFRCKKDNEYQLNVEWGENVTIPSKPDSLLTEAKR